MTSFDMIWRHSQQIWYHYHPSNERITRILRNFTILSSDLDTREVVPQSPLVSHRRHRDILHTSDTSHLVVRREHRHYQYACDRTCHHISTDTNLQSLDFYLPNVWLSLLHLLPPLPSGETGRTLRQRFGEQLRSIEKKPAWFSRLWAF